MEFPESISGNLPLSFWTVGISGRIVCYVGVLLASSYGAIPCLATQVVECPPVRKVERERVALGTTVHFSLQGWVEVKTHKPPILGYALDRLNNNSQEQEHPAPLKTHPALSNESALLSAQADGASSDGYCVRYAFNSITNQDLTYDSEVDWQGRSTSKGDCPSW